MLQRLNFWLNHSLYEGNNSTQQKAQVFQTVAKQDNIATRKPWEYFRILRLITLYYSTTEIICCRQVLCANANYLLTLRLFSEFLSGTTSESDPSSLMLLQKLKHFTGFLQVSSSVEKRPAQENMKSLNSERGKTLPSYTKTCSLCQAGRKIDGWNNSSGLALHQNLMIC